MCQIFVSTFVFICIYDFVSSSIYAFIYTDIYVCIYFCIYVWICIWIYVCVCVSVCVCICFCVSVSDYISASIYIYVSFLSVSMSRSIYDYTSTSTSTLIFFGCPFYYENFEVIQIYLWYVSSRFLLINLYLCCPLLIWYHFSITSILLSVIWIFLQKCFKYESPCHEFGTVLIFFKHCDNITLQMEIFKYNCIIKMCYDLLMIIFPYLFFKLMIIIFHFT